MIGDPDRTYWFFIPSRKEVLKHKFGIHAKMVMVNKDRPFMKFSRCIVCLKEWGVPVKYEYPIPEVISPTIKLMNQNMAFRLEHAGFPQHLVPNELVWARADKKDPKGKIMWLCIPSGIAEDFELFYRIPSVDALLEEIGDKKFGLAHDEVLDKDGKALGRKWYTVEYGSHGQIMKDIPVFESADAALGEFWLKYVKK